MIETTKAVADLLEILDKTQRWFTQSLASAFYDCDQG